MNLLMLALIKKSMDDRNAARARARNRIKRTEKGGKGYGSPYSRNSYTQNKYTELQHFYKVVDDDSLLVAFFQAIEKKGNEIDEKDAEEVRKKVEIGLKAQAERVEKIETVKKELKDLGLDTSYTSSYFAYEVTVGEKVLDSGNRAFGEKGEYAKVSKSFKLNYDGLDLVSDWFKPENREVNPFDSLYDEWYGKNGDLDEKITAQKVAIEKQERRVKYGLFKKDEKEKELKRLQEELDRLEKEKIHGEAIKKERDTFAQITPEQKDKLHEYYQLVEECVSQGREVDQDIKKYSVIKNINRGYYYNDRKKSVKERKKWERVVEELIAEGELSEELLDAVDTVISEEDIGYEKYTDGYDDYSMRNKGYSENFIDAVEWFLETRREKIALKALQRKESAYKLLKDEHKKLCDAAGLVDRAEELEGKAVPEEGDGEYGE